MAVGVAVDVDVVVEVVAAAVVVAPVAAAAVVVLGVVVFLGGVGRGPGCRGSDARPFSGEGSGAGTWRRRWVERKWVSLGGLPFQTAVVAAGLWAGTVEETLPRLAALVGG